MNYVYVVLAFLLGMVGGMALHRYVFSELKDAQKYISDELDVAKKHVTDELDKLRSDIGLVVDKNGRKIGR